MGKSEKGPLRVVVDRRLKLEFHGSKVTSDAGLLACRELDEVLGLTVMAAGVLTDWRIGSNTQHCLAALLRQSVPSRLAGYEGTNHSADDWRLVLEPVVARYRGEKLRRFFRGDAAFANPEVYRFLERQGFLYAIRLPANRVLQREIEQLLTRPVGRPPKKPIVWYESFSYRAAS